MAERKVKYTLQPKKTKSTDALCVFEKSVFLIPKRNPVTAVPGQKKNLKTRLRRVV